MAHRIIPAIAILLAACFAGLPAAAAGPVAGVVVFLAGDARVGGRPAALEQPLHEGDAIVTGADGYIYVKTIDDGFIILRPRSRARVLAYRVDNRNPANTRVKIELNEGVARSITGRAVRAARQNFRLNTPLAAIGVRGTDFTVFTDPQVTRIAVFSGGVVASAFAATCTPEGAGPCEGAASRELLAEQAGMLLQISRDQPLPQLLPANGNAPDKLAPPRSDEPARRASGDAPLSGTADADLEPQKATALFATPPAPVPPPSRILWGRWRAVMDQPAGIDVLGLTEAGAEIVAINSWYAVLRTTDGPQWQKPAEGAMGFALTGSEAWIINEPASAMTAARLENARLNVDFGRSAFTTGFDLVGGAPGERFPLQSRGYVTADGRLLGDSQFAYPTNMTVNGVLSGENGGSAAYLFQGRIDNSRLATGATFWKHQ